MSGRTTITLSNEDRAFAEELVRDGLFPDIDAAVSGAMRKLRKGITPSSEPVAEIAEELRARAKTPLEEFVDFDEETFVADVERIVEDRRVSKTAAE